jgi:ureidoacrylate peracid hydrolase
MNSNGPDIARSALIIVDMQNDFVHADGGFAQRLADAFREAGRPVIYIAHVLKPDYSDAQYPYWRLSRGSLAHNRTFIAEGTWGAQIIDELKPQDGEHLVVKKGFGGFSNTPLDTILRNMDVNTCVVSGVTTCVCVSTTIRGGVEHNYRMIVVKDAVAEVNRDTHEAELKTMQRVFADVKSTDEVVAMLDATRTRATARAQSR